jgi:hypothetical protein
VSLHRTRKDSGYDLSKMRHFPTQEKNRMRHTSGSAILTKSTLPYGTSKLRARRTSLCRLFGQSGTGVLRRGVADSRSDDVARGCKSRHEFQSCRQQNNGLVRNHLSLYCADSGSILADYLVWCKNENIRL